MSGFVSEHIDSAKTKRGSGLAFPHARGEVSHSHLLPGPFPPACLFRMVHVSLRVLVGRVLQCGMDPRLQLAGMTEGEMDTR